MIENQKLADGFFLGMELIESLGVKYDRAAVLNRLCDVAAGDMTLMNSPEEELAIIELERGVPSSFQERAVFMKMFSERRSMDRRHRATASSLLEVLHLEGFLKE